VIDRAVALLDCFTLEGPELGVGELSRLTGISKGTVHRLLGALQRHRVIEQNPVSRRYRLGFKLFELGNRAIARVDHVDRAEAFLHRLAKETGETTHLAVLDQGMTFYVAKMEGWHSLRMPSQVGRRLSSHCTGVGKALLAFASPDELERIVAEHGLQRFTDRTITSMAGLKRELARIRRVGYSVDRGEIEDGLYCVGAPVRDYTGGVVAAVSIAGPSTRINDRTIPGLAKAVVATAADVSNALGAQTQ
jgi:IclR family KDG regulon transcriptional repressor